MPFHPPARGTSVQVEIARLAAGFAFCRMEEAETKSGIEAELLLFLSRMAQADACASSTPEN